MIIQRRLKVSAEEFFDYLQFILLKEIKQNFSTTTKKKELVTGFELKKTYINNGTAECKTLCIEKIEYPLFYKISYNTNKGTQYVIHEIKKVKENLIDDIFEEDIKSSDPKIIFNKYWKASTTRSNMAKTLSLIEKNIISNRDK